MDMDRMEDVQDQVNEALREAKVEELAGYLMALHRLQVDIATGSIEGPSAMRKAKEITERAVDAHKDLKELTAFSLFDGQNVVDDGGLDWLEDMNDEDWEAFPGF